MSKIQLNYNVFEGAKSRISEVFDNCNKIYISFSGGKDSSVMTHLVCAEARKRNKKIGLMFIDWECQFNHTVKHIENMFEEYKDIVEPYWICGEIKTDSSHSVYEPEFTAWDENKKEIWVRSKPELAFALTKLDFYYPGITFEEFTPLFSDWYGKGETTCCFVGIRTQESLNRFRAIARDKENFLGRKYSTKIGKNSWNIYPIYDWSVNDIWTYNAKMKVKYNKLYDIMYQAGLTLPMMRVDEPFGETQKRSLWLYQVIEPETWAKLVARLNGVNTAGLYGKEKGLINGNGNIKLPNGYTWEKFTNFLLDTMPSKTAEHYRNKFAIYIHWWKARGYENGIPDEADTIMETRDACPSWRRIAKTILRGDYWCRWLGFSPTKTSAYQKYVELCKKRRKEWGIYNKNLDTDNKK